MGREGGRREEEGGRREEEERSRDGAARTSRPRRQWAPCSLFGQRPRKEIVSPLAGRSWSTQQPPAPWVPPGASSHCSLVP